MKDLFLAEGVVHLFRRDEKFLGEDFHSVEFSSGAILDESNVTEGSCSDGLEGVEIA